MIETSPPPRCSRATAAQGARAVRSGIRGGLHPTRTGESAQRGLQGYPRRLKTAARELGRSDAPGPPRSTGNIKVDLVLPRAHVASPQSRLRRRNPAVALR